MRLKLKGMEKNVLSNQTLKSNFNYNFRDFNPVSQSSLKNSVYNEKNVEKFNERMRQARIVKFQNI
jgi:hypothetical protein